MTFWAHVDQQFTGTGAGSLLTINPTGNNAISLTFDLCKSGAATNLVVSGRLSGTIPLPADVLGDELGGWFPVALSILQDSATIFVGRSGTGTTLSGTLQSFLGGTIDAVFGASAARLARTGVSVGEATFWSSALEYHDSGVDIASASLRPQVGTENGISGLYSFRGDDLIDAKSESGHIYLFSERVLDIQCTAANCSQVEKGPPLLDTAIIDADASFTPRVYVQNDPGQDGYNPNEEHGFVRAGSGGYVTWALRADLNRANSSEPGVLVEYVKGGRKKMKWFNVDVTSSLYPELAADCVAGKALPGPHPLDLVRRNGLGQSVRDHPRAP